MYAEYNIHTAMDFLLGNLLLPEGWIDHIESETYVSINRSDISGIRSMIGLENITFIPEPVDLSVLAELPKLRTISFIPNVFRPDYDLTVLTKLPRLAEIRLCVYANMDLSPLINMTNLKRLLLFNRTTSALKLAQRVYEETRYL